MKKKILRWTLIVTMLASLTAVLWVDCERKDLGEQYASAIKQGFDGEDPIFITKVIPIDGEWYYFPPGMGYDSVKRLADQHFMMVTNFRVDAITADCCLYPPDSIDLERAFRKLKVGQGWVGKFRKK